MNSNNQRIREEQELVNIANKLLTESGQNEILMQRLQEKLKECGWRERVDDLCRQHIAEIGLENVTVEALVEKVAPQARASVPSEVEREMKNALLTAVEEQLKPLKYLNTNT